MTFERGFKTEANAIALEVRPELGLKQQSPLCPWSLADHLHIPVLTLEVLANNNLDIAGHVDYLARREPQVFSAITIFDGVRRHIVHNHAHAPTRQRSDLAHELAHALLQHPPHPPFCTTGQRTYDSKLEAEAGWLGPVLLVPNEAARWAVANGMDEDSAGRHFGVSPGLINFRFRMSGARRLSRYMRRRSTM